MGEGFDAVGDGRGLQVSIESAVLFGCVELPDKGIVKLEGVGIPTASQEGGDLDTNGQVELADADGLDGFDVAAFDDRDPEGEGVLFLFWGWWGRRREGQERSMVMSVCK